MYFQIGVGVGALEYLSEAICSFHIQEKNSCELTTLKPLVLVALQCQLGIKKEKKKRIEGKKHNWLLDSHK